MGGGASAFSGGGGQSRFYTFGPEGNIAVLRDVQGTLLALQRQGYNADSSQFAGGGQGLDTPFAW